MSSPTRFVRRLRLRADSERAIHRAALLLEDALRTASLPDQAGRIVLVRRFALGRIDTQAAPQTLALMLERAIARMTAACVYVEDENAAQAAAVWFRDALDAHTKLALRLANGSPVDAWYWPLAVTAWRPHSTLPVALRRIMFSLATLPEAAVALPRWTAALASEGYIAQIAAALRADDIVPLARAAHVRIPTPMHSRSPPVSDAMTQAWSPKQVAQFPLAAAAEPFDPLHTLLRALLRAADVQAGKASAWARPPLSARTRSVTTKDQAAPDTLAADVAPPIPRPRIATVSRERSEQLAAVSERTEQSTAALETAPRRGRDTIELDRGDGFFPPTSEQPRVDTRAGGLLFLVPVLQRLGFLEWLEAQPEWIGFDIARRMMAIVLSRLRIARDDPAWSLAVWRSPAKRIAPRFVAPARWREGLYTGEGELRFADSATGATLWDASGRLALGAWKDACPRSLVRARHSAATATRTILDVDRASLVSNAWLVASRRWLRRFAGIGIASLVMRQGAIELSATHADAFFRLVDADMRVRRAGLDLDPGWVPWYGRVISFHYADHLTSTVSSAVTSAVAPHARGTLDGG
jgi:hypothetical protein